MKYRYIIITEVYGIFGTNSEELAKKAADFDMVIDVQEGIRIHDSDEPEIEEVDDTWYTDSEAGED